MEKREITVASCEVRDRISVYQFRIYNIISVRFRDTDDTICGKETNGKQKCRRLYGSRKRNREGILCRSRDTAVTSRRHICRVSRDKATR